MAKGRIWITRTRPGADKSAQAFEYAGFDTVIAPLLTITPPEYLPAPPEIGATLLMTSQNAVGALSNLTDNRHWPILTVGDATAGCARALGFESVNSASGNWTDLVKLVKQTIPAGTRLVHLCGDKWRGPIVETLNAAGYKANRTIIYAALPADQVPLNDLSDITHIAVHSPRAAKILSGFSPSVRHITAVSISPDTDKALGAMTFKDRIIASAPNEAAMLAALGA